MNKMLLTELKNPLPIKSYGGSQMTLFDHRFFSQNINLLNPWHNKEENKYLGLEDEFSWPTVF
jgi:hypothetical protein